MKILIVYYTRTGTTKLAAEALQRKLGCDIEEIIDRRDRSGAWGWIKSGRDAARNALTGIEEPKNDPADYDLVIIGSPVWVGTFAPAIRAYLFRFKDGIRQLAAFSTQGSVKKQKIFDEIKKFSNKELRAEMFLPTKLVRSQQIERSIDQFIGSLS